MQGKWPGIVAGSLGIAMLAFAGKWATTQLNKPRPAPYVCVAVKGETCPAEDFLHALDVQKQLQDELRDMEKSSADVKKYEGTQRELYGVSVQIESSKNYELKQNNRKWDEEKKKFIDQPIATPPADKPKDEKKK